MTRELFKLKSCLNSCLNAMVRFLGCSILSLLFALQACDTAGTEGEYQGKVFIKLYGGRGSEVGRDLARLDDGGFVLVGSSTSFSDSATILNRRDVFLVRTDVYGRELWSNSYTFGADAVGESVIVDRNGDIVISGSVRTDTLVGGREVRDILVLKINNSGALIGSARFGSADQNEYGTHVLEASTGGYLVTGTSESASGFDFFNVIRLNYDLSLVRENLIGDESSDHQSSVSIEVQGVPELFLSFGTSTFTDNPSQRSGLSFFIIKYDAATGIEKEPDAFGDARNNLGNMIAKALGQSQYLVAGYTEESPGRINARVERISETGIQVNPFVSDWIWVDDRGNTRAEDVILADDGNVVVLATIESVAQFRNEIEIIKLAPGSDAPNEVVWRSAFGSNEDDLGRRIVQLNDGGFAVVGTVGFEVNRPFSSSKMCLIRVNAQGELIP